MKNKMVKVEAGPKDIYVSELYIMRRGEDGEWELRKTNTLELIDSDRYRTNLAERNHLNINFKVVELW